MYLSISASRRNRWLARWNRKLHSAAVLNSRLLIWVSLLHQRQHLLHIRRLRRSQLLLSERRNPCQLPLALRQRGQPTLPRLSVLLPRQHALANGGCNWVPSGFRAMRTGCGPSLHQTRHLPAPARRWSPAVMSRACKRSAFTAAPKPSAPAIPSSARAKAASSSSPDPREITLPSFAWPKRC